MVRSNRYKRNDLVYINENIKAKQVRCVNKDNENIGILLLKKAITMAQVDGLDLVQISSSKDGIPTCKIVDYGKYMFDVSKKNKERAKKQRKSAVKQKEIKFRPNTDLNDLKTKARLAGKFIADGCRIRICIKFKGREVVHKYIAENKFNEFLNCIDADVSVLDRPRMDGGIMVAVLGGRKKVHLIGKAS